MKALSVLDFRKKARRRLPRFLFEYVDGGAFAETTLGRNCEDLEKLQLRQRVLTPVEHIDLSLRLFGQKLNCPIILAPIGLAGMNARRGEVQAARAAASRGVPFTLSTVSACSIREVQEGANSPFWFQLYMIRDRVFMRDLLAQARHAGCTTLVFTVDMPVPGTRYRDYRSGLAGASNTLGSLRRALQALMHPRWAWDVGVMGRPHQLGNVAPILKKKTGLEDFFAWMRGNFDPTVDWKSLEWIRTEWRGPLILKGILDVEDARLAVKAGADGIVVSNHGGRQLDGAPSTAEALPAIAREVGEQLTVLADGGIRSGLDVVRMLALGARGVMIGRAWAYALAAGGETAVGQMLDNLVAELRVAMALTACRSLPEINSSILYNA